MESQSDRGIRTSIGRWPKPRKPTGCACGKISGAVTARKALARAIAELGPGDCFVVTRLDRLARSTTEDLLNTLDAIAKAGAGFRSLADAWADTTIRMGD
jgi:DNA invertase Pin-like site-specific DNA recombinase